MEYVSDILTYPVSSIGRGLGASIKRGLEHLHDHVIPHPRNNYHPHLLGHRALALISMLMLAAKIVSIAALTMSPAESAFSSDITATNIINLTNASRAANGLQALTSNSQLTEAAQAKARALLDCQCFSHNIGTKTPWDFIKAAGYQYLMAGENLAVNFVDAETEHEAWMNSSGHRANILNSNFEEIGIGIISGSFQGGDSIIVVQMFGLAAEQNVAVSPKPTPVAPKPGLQPQSASAAPETVAPAPTLPTPIPETIKPSITNTELSRDGDNLKITATSEGPVSKVTATYGKQAVMLEPKSETVWEGSVPINALTESGQQLTIVAYDINGVAAASRVASFSQDLPGAFAPINEPEQKQASFFGYHFDYHKFTQNFYLLLAASILAAMILAIGIRRHVQHVHMIANGSFVVMLAMLLWHMG